MALPRLHRLRLRYHADEPKCPRCTSYGARQCLPSYEFAGFVAVRNESPVLDEEERFAERNLVKTYPSGTETSSPAGPLGRTGPSDCQSE